MIRREEPAGFSLIEIIFAMAVGVLLLTAIYTVVESGQKTSVAIDQKVGAQQDVRAAIQVMMLEMEMASYNSTFASGIWRNTSCGNSPSPVQTYKGIQEATANSLTIEMDLDDSSAIGDGTNEILRYVYDPVNQFVTRDSNCLGAQPFLGDDPASGRPRAVRVINDQNGSGAYEDGVDIPVFAYFNGAGTQIPFASLPASIPDIRRIDITLQVETDQVSPDTGQRRRMIYSTSVLPRNHAFHF